MKKIFSNMRLSLLAVGVMATMQCCNIDIDPTDRYTDVAVWKNPSNIELYISGMYAEFQTFKFGAFPIGYSNASDALSDIMKYTANVAGNGTVNILATDASRVTASTPQLSYWQAAYTRIRRINEFLDGMTKYATIDENAKAGYEAEARFVRGYVYFWLARLHGSFVIMDNMSQYSTNARERSSEEDCWKFIAQDFQYAADHLPVIPVKSGRATKGAAYAMLARTWLYAASIAEYDQKLYNSDPLTGVAAANAPAYYQNAANAAQAVKDLASQGYYKLESVFSKKNTTEAVFKISFVAPQLTHTYDLTYTPPGDAPGQALSLGVPTAELVNEFEMADGTRFSWSNASQAANPYVGRELRFYSTILYNGAPWKGRNINTTAANATEGFTQFGVNTDPRRTVTGYYIKKNLDSLNTTFVTYGSTQDWVEIRYAEVLLIHAEAEAKLNHISSAQSSLNEVRNRAGLPNTNASTTVQLMEAVEHERKVELAFEGHRYWDLRRWRKAHTVLNNVRFTGHKISAAGTGYTYETVSADNANRQFTGALYYIPIPASELQNNTALTQIKGW
ncbi:RagB/SusD family nutrient uptake outer membrane protein [Filimonas effusa]|uniref:RagB/SusD family nutrient uptake outer membrane protein n=1 Tax=Filimonas effusa TaxID=2508721 RepID=A0A4Q1D3E2_9BACT|nr:RagB/SusD family nutrient uptake outer membrane protein [Filimonas effusa]RXK82885.1 RagB/SusD family nutrient uptake outer membrane protein [Filimonas effusa]